MEGWVELAPVKIVEKVKVEVNKVKGRKKIKYDQPNTKNATASHPIIAYKLALRKKKEQ